MVLSPTQQIQQLLSQTRTALVATKAAYGMDGLASCIALAEALEKLGKEVTVATHGFRIVDEHKVLPKADRVCDELKKKKQIVVSLDIPKEHVSELRYGTSGDKIQIIITPKIPEASVKAVETKELNGFFDIIFCVDTPDLASLGKLFEDNTDLFYHTPIINIDHNGGNEQYGEVNIVDTTAVSASEVTFRLLQSLSQAGTELLGEDIATCLLAGMIAKTHCFKSPNVTPRALSIASELVTRGARREDIVCKLYQNKSIETLQFWGMALSRLQTDSSGRIVWSTITSKDAPNPNEEQRLLGVVDELIANMPRAEIVVFFVADENHIITSHIISLKGRDVLSLASSLHPEGTRLHAHINLGEGELKPAIEKTIQCLQAGLG